MNWPLIVALIQCWVYAGLYVRERVLRKKWERRAKEWAGYSREWKKECLLTIVERMERAEKRRRK